MKLPGEIRTNSMRGFCGWKTGVLFEVVTGGVEVCVFSDLWGGRRCFGRVAFLGEVVGVASFPVPPWPNVTVANSKIARTIGTRFPGGFFIFLALRTTSPAASPPRENRLCFDAGPA